MTDLYELHFDKKRSLKKPPAELLDYEVRAGWGTRFTLI